MSYNYLLELYETIDGRRQDARRKVEASAEAERQHLRGQLDVLEELERFLKENYNAKLPRRIRVRLEGGG